MNSESLHALLTGFLPEWLLLAMAIVLLMVGAFAKERSVSGVLIASVLTLLAGFFLLSDQSVSQSSLWFKDMLRMDPFTQFTKLLIVLGSLLALIVSAEWLRAPQRRKFEYPILLLLCSVGLMLLVSANDFLMLYMALELASLSLYVMAAFDRDNGFASEAGIKYFILGALASGMMLFGISLVYGFSGTTNFELLADLTGNEGYRLTAGLAVGLVMVMVGLCFKVSAVPFHMWTPDVYEGAPTPVVTYFAVAPKIAAMALFARILMEPFAALTLHWQPIVVVVSMGSMLVGAFGALMQQDIKRLLAYSSIGHIGYALIGIATHNPAGIQAMLIYLSLYLFMSIGAFGFVLCMQRGGLPVTTLSSLGGLSRNCPRSALFLALIMFSMAGIPPLAGFFAKFYIFKAAVAEEMYALVIVGLFSSVVAAYYYLKVVKIMYFDRQEAAYDGDVPLHHRAVLAICALVTGFFFLSPSGLLQITQEAVSLF